MALGIFEKEKGVIHSGNFTFLAIQFLGAFVIFSTVFLFSYVYFKMVKMWFHLRLSKIEELLGLDLIEDSQTLQAQFN